MYKKSLWKPIMAGTLALAMTLSPLAAGSAVAAAEVEATEPAGDIALNAKNFPDAKFRKYLSENVDTDKNGILSKSERNA